MEKLKSVFLLMQDWACNGDTLTNDVMGVFGNEKAAKKRLVEEIYDEFSRHDYANVEVIPGTATVGGTDLKELSSMFADNPDFDTDLTGVECYDGDEQELSERRFSIWIERRIVVD